MTLVQEGIFVYFFSLWQILACCRLIQSHRERLGRTDAHNLPVLLSVARCCPARRIGSCLLHSGKKGEICVPHHLPLLLCENRAHITAGKQEKKNVGETKMADSRISVVLAGP